MSLSSVSSYISSWVGDCSSCSTLIAVAGGYAALILLNSIWSIFTAPGFKVKGKHLIITGGSAGLGLATAVSYAKAGAKDAAGPSPPPVHTYTCDVSDFLQVKGAIAAAVRAQGPPDHVICCAGEAIPGYFLDQDVSIFHKQNNVNYLGVLHTVKAAVPHMIDAKIQGTVVLVSSLAAFIGWVGMTQYVPGKFAVKGLGDCLRNELLAYGIKVHVFYPSSINTEGFETENKTKPPECAAIEGSADLVSPEYCAKRLIQGIGAGEFSIVNDPVGSILRIAGNGVVPRNNAPLEWIMLPFLGVFQWGFVKWMDYIVLHSQKAKDYMASKKSQ